jgi:hypothetical protein
MPKATWTKMGALPEKILLGCELGSWPEGDLDLLIWATTKAQPAIVPTRSSIWRMNRAKVMLVMPRTRGMFLPDSRERILCLPAVWVDEVSAAGAGVVAGAGVGMAPLETLRSSG